MFRAIDDLGWAIDVYVSPTRYTSVASAFQRQAVGNTGVRSHTATIDRAAIYPSAPRAVPPEVAHRAGKTEQRRIERDHGDLNGRYRPMPGFKARESARTIRAGQGFIRNPWEGFRDLGVDRGAPPLRGRHARCARGWS